MRTFEAAQQDAAHAASCPRRGFSVSLAFPSLRRLFRRLARLLRGLLLRGGPLRRSPLGSGFPGRFSLRRGLPRGFLLRGLLFHGDLLLLGRRLLPRRSLGRRSTCSAWCSVSTLSKTWRIRPSLPTRNDLRSGPTPHAGFGFWPHAPYASWTA